jgi:hypothetical protein
MFLFAGLSSAQKLTEKFNGTKEYQKLDYIYINSLLEFYMIMFGDNPKKDLLNPI